MHEVKCNLKSSKNCKKALNSSGLNRRKKNVPDSWYKMHLQFFEIFSISSVPYSSKNTLITA